ncbi:TRAP transporter small permease [Salinicola acroporae]|uniref:TRAP transporter small permease protein n=1 Tax=Salinicola acroporae TaxID=1541440 RepID=A0ABT6I5N3_9GAMM|nr:TRAP transporter small permease [Salinicola acroporae]MDH4572856.1 TRAP transporter small permease [Salinicola acroporae]
MTMLNVGLKSMRYFMILCLACMVLLVFANVLLRYLFDSSIYIAEGGASLLFVWMTFVGAALVVYERGLIAVDVVVSKLPSIPRSLCEILINIAMLGVSVMIFRGSWHQTILNLNVISSSTLLSSALLYASGVFFSIISGGIMIVRLIKSVSKSFERKSALHEGDVNHYDQARSSK